MQTSPSQTYSSLSLKDLLDARDAYHIALMKKSNVRATAVGLYLVRNDEVWPTRKDFHPKKVTTPRRLSNSSVTPFSWPCVLVFVNQWIYANEFGKLYDPSEAIPRTLYLPDGRSVPVCVVEADFAQVEPQEPKRNAYPDYLIGGGFPLSVDVQGETRDASVGCLVTDGHTHYVLTNRHVVGEPGSPVYAVLRGERERIGEASELQIGRMPFSEVYDVFAGTNTYCTLDVGLVEIDDVADWTSRPYGLENVGPVGDINEYTLSLQLVDQHVQCYGAASGKLRGRIKALFYRYKSIGGYDYVSDFLIAPEGGASTRPGDSGTIWYLETAAALAPIAVEWGGQAVRVGENNVNFTLAANLSTVCRLLDVDLAWGNDTAVQPFWGATGHFSIARIATTLLQSNVAGLMTRNADNIAFDLDKLKDPTFVKKQLPHLSFIPLADVPDLVWKKPKGSVPGGRDTAPNVGPEHPNHFADGDEPNPARRNVTLRNFSLADPQNNLTPKAWLGFYHSLYQAKGETQQHPSSKYGLLPFRVWQIFDLMVDFAKTGKLPQFVCAAGVLAHYVGDACQPLHGSYLADGYSDQPTSGPKAHPTNWPAKGVHSAYEDNMVDMFASQLFPLVTSYVRKKSDFKDMEVTSGADAALFIVELMQATGKQIPPPKLCTAYEHAGGGKSKNTITALWNKFGADTALVMSWGVQSLASIWDAAWRLAGDKSTARSGSALTQAHVRRIVDNAAFAPSYTLVEIEGVLK